MIKLLSQGEKSLDTSYAVHSGARLLRKLRLAAVFSATVSMVLAACSVGQFSAFPQQTAIDAILLFVSSAVAYLYALFTVAFSSEEELSHISLEDDGSSVIAARRKRTRQSTAAHLVCTTVLALFLTASWAYAAYRDSKGYEACATYWSPTPTEYVPWNRVACKLMTASTVFSALSTVNFAALAVVLHRQLKRSA